MIDRRGWKGSGGTNESKDSVTESESTLLNTKSNKDPCLLRLLLYWKKQLEAKNSGIQGAQQWEDVKINPESSLSHMTSGKLWSPQNQYL